MASFKTIPPSGNDAQASDPCVCFVGNLAWSTTNEDLVEYMSSAGQVTSATIQIHEDTGRSKGWALVAFATPEQATFAVHQFELQEFHDRQLSVRLDRTPLQGAPGCLLYVGNLSWSCGDAELCAEFAGFSPTDARVAMTASGKSRGYGLLRFLNPENAAAAIRAKHGAEFNERVLEVREDQAPVDRQRTQTGGKKSSSAPAGAGGAVSRPKSDNESNASIPASDTLYVHNLSWDSTDDSLFQHFCASAGAQPLSAQVLKSLNGRSKGWGLVVFADAGAAESGRTGLDKTELDGRTISVRFNSAGRARG
mmetsp:Transcript_61056/g.119763  ORF Transcript_61056/g.119763 Transcript_61056/m.119763 type:complete len:309 (+) Transcript_61056:33-959(+)|eukprot:CAMPEP_0171953274 /NCGR_PEP_ID=MMETSP0993-20121228/93914_1 /TAXON_ID=483369 /ORGANISM="non described non described, Strain CCMP2098" /LENGTH=308 /DNA_ID=CAMNT_0012598891 /DNA_START=33 /DNA_END=959 /DNA_ORIENTATION=-